MGSLFQLRTPYPHLDLVHGGPSASLLFHAAHGGGRSRCRCAPSSSTRRHTVTHPRSRAVSETGGLPVERIPSISTRIDEKRSSNRHGPTGNQWLHPDMVGLEISSADWEPEICACVDEYKDKKAKLWSFEVKRLLNHSIVRESFFQAVSNSSWAHFGYLVAAEISSTGTGVRRELEILSSIHGIGVILLAEPAGDSQIIVPARERPAIDWDSCNRLAATNADFKKYIKYVRQFCQTGEVKDSDWDLPERDGV